jgi:GNAT superfamily N-acetyltransferase
MSASILVRPVAASDEGALAELFARADVRCHCRWWHFHGDKNDWLDRCANAADVNRGELAAGLASGSEDALGVVARDGERGPIRGWAKIAPGASTPKIFEQRYYRSLPIFAGDRAELAILACLLVDPDARHRGVARALVAGAVELAHALVPRAKYLVATPRVTTEPVSDGELWLGPRAIFDGLGFEEVHAEPPYPVLRKRIA